MEKVTPQNKFLIGAFGEVRKAVHKITLQTRAVKIISKRTTSSKDQERLINEVNVLKTLVFVFSYRRITLTL